MSRPKESRGKMDVARAAVPLQHNPFALLGEVDALKNLPAPAPEKKEARRDDSHGLPLQAAKTPPKARGRLILRREKKDRGGKVVVVVYGFEEVPGANAVMIADLAKELKGKLGCGGSFDRREIVLQGDRPAEVSAVLGQLGFQVRGVTV